MNLLVIEDDKNCVKLIGLALRGLYDSILFTDRLSEAMDMLNSDLNAIWLDLSLTDSDAADTVAKIPEMRLRCPQVTLLVVSGYGEKFKQTALDMGADVYASKLDLGGFDRSLIAQLFTKAALRAIERGVDATIVVQSVSNFLKTIPQTPVSSN